MAIDKPLHLFSDSRALRLYYFSDTTKLVDFVTTSAGGLTITPIASQTVAIANGGNLTVAGTLGVTGAVTLSSTLAVSGAVTNTSGALTLGVSDSTRGFVTLHGQGAGQTTGGEVRFHQSADHDATSEYGWVAAISGGLHLGLASQGTSIQLADALITLVDPVSLSSTLAVAGAVTMSATLTVTGNIIANGLITQSDNTDFLIITGGTAGANIELYGGTHATLSNRVFYDADTHTWRTVAAGNLMSLSSAGALAVTGTLSVSGVATFADGTTSAPGWAFSAQPGTGFYRPASNTIGIAIASAERFRFSGAGFMGIAEGANANMTIGLTINQAANDNQAFCLKSSDVATGLTSATSAAVETDDFFTIQKRDGATGGAILLTLAESTSALAFFHDAYAGAPQTTDTNTSLATMNWFVAQHNGSNALADMAADSNGFAWGEITAAGTRLTRMLLKADDGELHLGNTTLVALDHEDDVQAVRALQVVRTEGRGIKRSRFDRPVYNYDALRQMGVVGERDEHGDFLIRVQPYLNLHDGAIWQLHTRTASLEEAFRHLLANPNDRAGALRLLEA